MACSVTYVALKIIDLLLGVWREKIVSAADKAFAEQLFPLLGKSAKVAVIVAAAILTADNLNIKVTSLLAGLSIGGLALGLAAQEHGGEPVRRGGDFLDKAVLSRRPHQGRKCGRHGRGHRPAQHARAQSGRTSRHDSNKLMGNAIITNVTRRPTIRTEMNLGPDLRHAGGQG